VLLSRANSSQNRSEVCKKLHIALNLRFSCRLYPIDYTYVVNVNKLIPGRVIAFVDAIRIEEKHKEKEPL
jgi:hypothetical protein